MISVAQQFTTTEQEYLAGELTSSIKHELIDGQVYAMAGASDNHNRIIANLSRHIGNHLQNSPCDIFIADMKIKIEYNFYYPDLMVVCTNFNDNEYYRTSPILIVEVLSPSTRKMDKVYKRHLYQKLPSLQEYVLIEQNIVEVEISRRATNWRPEYYFLGDTVYFSTLELSLPIENLYARVNNAQMLEWRSS